MVAANNDYVVYVDPTTTPTYYAKDLITGDLKSNASFAALMSTLNTAFGSSGGNVIMRPGTYDLTAQLNPTNPINIKGAGKGRTIIRRQMTTSSGASISLTASNITIRDLTIDGNYPTADSNFTEFYTGGNDVLIDNVEVKNQSTFAISNFGSAYITKCHFGPCTKIGPSSGGGLYCGGNARTIFDNNTVYNQSGGGIFAQGVAIIKNCYVGMTTTAYGGGQVANGGAITTFIVQNCVIDPGPGTAIDSGIEFGPINAGIIPEVFAAIGNKINGGQGYGIVTDPSFGAIPLVIAKNQVKNFAASGILMWGTNQKYFSITDNICYDDQPTPTQKYGIIVGSVSGNYTRQTNADFYEVRDNLCYNNVYGQWSDNGTGKNKIVEDNLTQ